jgi:hypothetical protein
MRFIVRERDGLEAEETTAALAAYIVGEIERLFPSCLMGRSRLQKLFYVLSREGHFNIAFDLFMNGPYSDTVEDALGTAVDSGMMSAVMENGRSSISARAGASCKLPPHLKDEANRCIRAYGFYDEGDLAIVTTALFLEDSHGLGPDDLIRAVMEVNPRFDARRVCSLLDRSDVIFRSW